jgi:hypothetical protein
MKLVSIGDAPRALTGTGQQIGLDREQIAMAAMFASALVIGGAYVAAKSMVRAGRRREIEGVKREHYMGPEPITVKIPRERMIELLGRSPR